MRSYLRSRELLGSDVDHRVSYRLSVAKRTCWNGGRCQRFVLVMDLVDVGYVCDVRDVGYAADVGDVDCLQVSDRVVVPGEEWLAWSKRKPTN
jgi:hypothetical protein